MKFIKYFHSSGKKVVPGNLIEMVEQNLGNVTNPVKYGKASIIRKTILDLFHQDGWSNQVRINAKHSITLTSKYGKVALCLQTGNMARFYADLLKLQSQYIGNKITSAIYILPTADAANILGSNLANYERLTSELKDVYRKVITVPMVIYGFY